LLVLRCPSADCDDGANLALGSITVEQGRYAVRLPLPTRFRLEFVEAGSQEEVLRLVPDAPALHDRRRLRRIGLGAQRDPMAGAPPGLGEELASRARVERDEHSAEVAYRGPKPAEALGRQQIREHRLKCGTRIREFAALNEKPDDGGRFPVKTAEFCEVLWSQSGHAGSARAAA
jgi:hypothetical protein